MAGRYRNNNAPNSAYDALTALGVGIRVANGMPNPASNDQPAFTVGSHRRAAFRGASVGRRGSDYRSLHGTAMRVKSSFRLSA